MRLVTRIVDVDGRKKPRASVVPEKGGGASLRNEVWRVLAALPGGLRVAEDGDATRVDGPEPALAEAAVKLQAAGHRVARRKWWLEVRRSA